MYNTYEREMLANERYHDLLRSAAKRQQIDEATSTGRTTGFFTTLFGLRRNVPATLPTAPVSAARAA
jgi:hypothetical protein